MTKLSIVIPNYNNEKFIGLCIKSILNQSFDDYEIFVIDDGSCDKSLEIIESLAKDNKKITIISQFNQNASIARNKGLEKASGEYIYFIDGDDYLNDVDVLDKMINKIGDNDLLLCNYNIINEDNKIIDSYEVSKDLIDNADNNIEKYAFVSAVPSNKLFKASIIKENNIYFDNVDIGQDLNFYIKYLACCNKITVTNDYSYCYRRTSTGMTRNINYNLLDIVKSVECIKKFYLSNGVDKKNENVINALGIINYSVQMNKLEKFDNKEDKKFIYNYFNYFIKKIYIEKEYVDRNKKLKKTIKLYRIKRMMKVLFLSKYYSKIKAIILKS